MKTSTSPWLLTTPLVAKPDQLIKRRGKAGLLKLNASWEEVKAWVSERRGTRIEVDGVSDTLSHFIVEPFVAHDQTQELYICIASKRTGNSSRTHPPARLTIWLCCCALVGAF